MKVRLGRVAIIVSVTLVGAYLALCAAMFKLQRAMVYPAPAVDRGLLETEVVQIPQGTPMFWVPPRDGASPVVVHFHGNGEQLASLRFLAHECSSRGWGFAAPEYPGYGLAGPEPSTSEAGILRAAELALNHLTGPLAIDRARLVLSGQSLGTGVAVQMAVKGWGKRVVLLSPYSSLPEVGARALPFLPVRLLMTERFDSYSAAPGVSVPVLVIHGTRDEVIPFDLGQRLSERFSKGKRLEIEGGHHNDLWSRPEVGAAYFDFVAAP